MQGPQLTGLGEKTHRDWLFSWLKDPAHYSPSTAMPNLRLSDDEAADLVAYVLGEQDSSGAAPETTIDDNLAREILREHRARREPAEALDSALAALRGRPLHEELGRRLIGHYGCAGCHDIAGTESMSLIGPELSNLGRKPLHEFDFGIDVTTSHSKSTWLLEKLSEPRSFDKGRDKEPLDQLRMPQFDFSPEERDAIVTALLGFAEVPEGHTLNRHLSERESAIEAGQRLIRRNHCTGCHLLDGRGGALNPILTEWLKQSKGYGEMEAQTLTPVYAPPQLDGEGSKVRSDWLFDFLFAPETIRPWLHVRMPTYVFNDDERNVLVRYFAALEDEPFPFVAAELPDVSSPLFDAGKKLFSEDYFNCGSCHIQGDIFPGGDADGWAPDFALSARRLKPAWITRWLYDPQVLQSGTKMPTYFDPEYFDESGPDDILGGDEHQHILALRAYVLGISSEGPPQTGGTVPDGDEQNAVADPTAIPTSSAAPAAGGEAKGPGHLESDGDRDGIGSEAAAF